MTNLFKEFIIIDDPKARMRKAFDDFESLDVCFFGPGGFGEQGGMISTVRFSRDSYREHQFR
jgi:hypothetical protein